MTVALACPKCGAPLPARSRNEQRDVCLLWSDGGARAESDRTHCRARRRITTPKGGVDRSLLCPRCADGLRAAQSSACVFHGWTMSGVSIDNKTVEHLRTYATTRSASPARRTARSHPHRPRPPTFGELPRVQERAARVPLADTIHSIDVCDSHGTWFDRDELATFVTAFADARPAVRRGSSRGRCVWGRKRRWIFHRSLPRSRLFVRSLLGFPTVPFIEPFRSGSSLFYWQAPGPTWPVPCCERVPRGTYGCWRINRFLVEE